MENLEEIRKRRGMTRNALAQRAGMTERHILRLERGQIATPHRETLTKLATVLGVPVEELRGETWSVPRSAIPFTAWLTSIDPETAFEIIENVRDQAEAGAKPKAFFVQDEVDRVKEIERLSGELQRFAHRYIEEYGGNLAEK